tara:strand:- start:80420 stop:80782 length:363 start_codon:yes stop_codon:yes gene_type:complete
MARRGAPSKEEAIKNRKGRLEKKLVEEVLKANELMLDNYGKCVEVLVKAATGEMKDISATNQISSAKFIKQMVDDLLKQDDQEEIKSSQSEEDQKEKPEAKATGTTGQVYSLIQPLNEEK